MAPGRPLDLRLLLPALGAWAAAVALLPHGPRAQLVAGLCALVLGVAVRVAAGRSTLGGQVALTSVATALVLLAAAGHGAAERAGVVTELAGDRAVVRFTGLVLTEPRVVERGDERADLVVLRLALREVRARGESSTPSSPVLVFVEAGRGWEEVAWRSEVAGLGRLAPPQEPASDVVAVLAPRSPPTTVSGPSAALSWADPVRARLRAAVGPLPADARGLIPGLVIGDTSLTPADLSEAMLATGMSHLSAVSGSNVAIVLGTVVLLCRWCGVPRRWRPAVALVGLVAFVVLCRPEPSVLRAGAMGIVGLVALSTSRRRVSLPALAVAVLVLLCADPSLARSYGFALSTLATLGLVVFARPWGDAIARRLPRRAALVGDAVAIPLAAQVVCAPVIVLLQGDISTIAVVANLLAAPLVAPTTVAGICAAVVGVAWVPAATVVAWVAALPAWLLGRIARACATVPFGQVDWVDGAPGAWLLAVVTVCLLVAGPRVRWECRRHPRRAVAAVVLLGAVLWPLPGPGGWPPPGWVVVGCDVGQGDAFVVPTGVGSAVLVDTGPDPEPVVGCLRRLGVASLDAVVLSHFHADHVGGLEAVLAELPVAAAYVSPVRDPRGEAERVLAALAEADVATFPMVTGDRVTWGEAEARVVWPDTGVSPLVGANDASIVLDVTVRSTRMLFTGDIERAAAGRVRRRLAGERFDVLKVAHHGSADQDEALVAGLGARVAMVGVGADNSFGHPTPSALALLRRTGAVVLRTDLAGDVAVVERQEGLAVTSRGGR